MDFDNKTRIAYPEGANTNDIIKAMIEILPTGIAQVKNSENFVFKSTGKPYLDGIAVCRYIRRKVKYKKDSLQNQNIQLPGRLLNGTKQGDCKSFSLAFASIMNALGYNAGFRFASYSKNKIPTHVYNFVLVNGKKLIFDACVENLKESSAYTYIEDSPMKVNYLSAPFLGTNYGQLVADLTAQGRSKTEIAKILNETKARDEAMQTAAGGSQRRRNKILLSSARIAFLGLVRLNFRGLATKFVKLGTAESKSFWEEKGGDFDKLQSAINAGKNKKAIFGQSKKPINGIDTRAITGFNYIYGPEAPAAGADGGVKLEEITKFLGPAAAIIEAVVKLFKKKNVEDPEGLEKTVQDFDIPAGSETTTFTPSPMLIGGGIAAAILLFYLLKKK